MHAYKHTDGRFITLNILMTSQLKYCSVYVHHTTISGNRFSVQDHAVFPEHVHVAELKTKKLGLPPDAFLLHLARNHLRAATAVILTAQSR